MRPEATAAYPELRPRSGVLVVDGYGIKLRVTRGRLDISDGIGRERRHRQLARSSRDVQRLVLLGHTGYVTLEAHRWMADIGIGFCHMDLDGRILLSSDTKVRDEPALRRAQAIAPFDGSQHLIGRSLVMRKVRGQSRVLAGLGEPWSSEVFEHELEAAGTVAELRRIEANAANRYWSRLSNRPLRFDRASLERVPHHWTSFGARGSGLGPGARLATTPSQAILNYCYRLAEVESRFALASVGLDPGLGVLHVDQKGRASMALDLLEVVRPQVDGWVLNLIAETTFRASDFHETRRGSCRILPPLTHVLAETLGTWRDLLAPVADQVAGWFANGARSPKVRATGRLRNTASQAAAVPAPGRPQAVTGRPKRCELCSTDLPKEGRRKLCDTCLPAYEEARTARLSGAGRRTLAEMRASADDPARTSEARARLSATSKERMLAIRAWERINGRSHDWDRYRTEIVPLLTSMTVPELMDVTGLSQHFCWQVRAGKKRLHPMHWARIVGFAAARS